MSRPRRKPHFPINVADPRLTGPNALSDAPLTVEDWRIVHHAYMAFMTTVRRVAAEAWKRETLAARAPADRREG